MDDGATLLFAEAGEVPKEQLYAKLVVEGDRVEGEWRRKRDAEFHLWELPTGTVVRWQRVVQGLVVEDHLLDAAGAPWVTLELGPAGPLRAVVSAAPPIELDLAGWTPQPVPGGTMLLPAAPGERAGGGVTLEVLGGTLEVWTGAGDDVFSDAFGQGLAAGCGCAVLDRATSWIDGRPGVRYRLAVPGPHPEALDLWAVSGPEGTWVLTFRVPAAADAVEALLPARVLAAGTVFSEPEDHR
jgi:hypothetical protein